MSGAENKLKDTCPVLHTLACTGVDYDLSDFIQQSLGKHTCIREQLPVFPDSEFNIYPDLR